MLLLKQRGVGRREALAFVPQALRSCDCPPSQAAWGSPCQPGPERSWLEAAGTRTERLVTSVSQKPTVRPKAGQHARQHPRNPHTWEVTGWRRLLPRG